MQVTAYGRQTVPDRGVVRSSDSLQNFGAPIISLERRNIKVKYTSICIAHFYAKRFKCAQTWITQFYLQITPYPPLLSSRRTSPPFGWYSFYHPTDGRKLSRPGWLFTYRNKVPPREKVVKWCCLRDPTCSRFDTIPACDT